MASNYDILVKIGADVSNFGKELGRISKQFDDLQKTTEKNQFSFSKLAGSIGLVAVAAKGLSVLRDSMDAAISRFDTLNQFPRVLQSLGVDAEDSERSIQRLSDGIDGLPTKLDEIASTAQRMYTSFDDMDKATDSAIALNNALLGSGSSAADAQRGTEMYLKALQTGRMEMDTWNSLQQTMDVGLIKVAEAMGYTGKSAKQDLYEALRDGHVTMDDFNDKLIELGTGTGVLADLARENSLGIATSLSNLRTAASRGLADIIASFNKLTKEVTGKDIAQNIDSLKVFINQSFRTIGSIIEGTAPYVRVFFNAIGALIPVVKALTPALIGMASSLAIHSVISRVNKALSESKTITEAVRIAKDLYAIAVGRATAAEATSVTVTKLSTVAIAAQNKILAASTLVWQVFTRQIGLMTAAKRIAIATAGAFRAAMTFLTGPVGIATAVIGGVVGAAVGFVKWLNRSSKEAEKLAKETDALVESTEALNEEIANSASAYEDNVKEIDNSAESYREVAKRIDELARKENKSAADKQMLKGYVDQLNDSVEGLNLTYDEHADSMNLTSKELQARIDLMSEEERMTSAQQRLLEIEQERNAVQMQLKEINALRAEANELVEEGGSTARKARQSIEELDEQEQELIATLDALVEQQKITETQVEESAEAMAQATEDANIRQIKSYEKLEGEKKKAFDRMVDEYERLRDAATDAFDKISMESEYSLSELAENLEHNADVTRDYAKNFATLMEWGAEQGHDGFMLWLETLGVDQAAYLADMVEALESSNDEQIAEILRLAEAADVAYGEVTDNMLTRMGEGFEEGVYMTEEFVNDENQLLTSEASTAGFYQYGKKSVENIVEGAESQSRKLINAFKGLARDIIKPIEDAKNNVSGIGRDITRGLEGGIRSGENRLLGTARRIANNVTNTMRGALRIQSPSRVLMELGKWIPLGLAKGITDYARQVTRASELLVHEATPNIDAVDLSYNTPNGLHSTLASAVTGTVDVNSRDDMIASAIASLGDRIENMRIEMDRREFGRFVSEEVVEGTSASIRGGGRRRIL